MYEHSNVSLLGLQTWKANTINELNSPENIRNTLIAKRFKISEVANNVIDKINMGFIGEIVLIKIPLGKIGFKEATTRMEVYCRALDSGLKLCPHEVAIWLRMYYVEQPKDERLLIATEPITYKHGTAILSVEQNNGNLWLDAYSGCGEVAWGYRSQWVFCV